MLPIPAPFCFTSRDLPRTTLQKPLNPNPRFFLVWEEPLNPMSTPDSPSVSAPPAPGPKRQQGDELETNRRIK